MTNEQIIKIYVRAMEKRIDHHAQEFYWIWRKYLRPELESGRWTAYPRKGRTHRFGIAGNFVAGNGNTLTCRYTKGKLWLSSDVKERAFGPRHGRSALNFIQKLRA